MDISQFMEMKRIITIISVPNSLLVAQQRKRGLALATSDSSEEQNAHKQVQSLMKQHQVLLVVIRIMIPYIRHR